MFPVRKYSTPWNVGALNFYTLPIMQLVALCSKREQVNHAAMTVQPAGKVFPLKRLRKSI
jgi:hypothetical protein